MKKIKNENNIKSSILNQIKISENSLNLIGKSLNKKAIYDLGDILNNIKSIKSNSIKFKQKNNLITNLNNSKLNNYNNNYLRNPLFHSIDKISKKTIEKDNEINNNNDLHLSSKTFHFNNINKKDVSLNDEKSNHRNRILKKNSHELARNIDNFDIDNLINKFKQYKIINKNSEKNNININLNINNIQNIQNIQNIETIDINKIKPSQRLFLIKNEIFNSYVNCGKVYRDKNPQDQHFKTLQNYSHGKNKNNLNYNYIFSKNANTFRNSNNTSNIKHKINSIRDNLYSNKNGKKNIKLNYNLLVNNANINNNSIKEINNNNQDYLPKFTSFETINNNKRNISLKHEYNNSINNNCNYDICNEFLENRTINNDSIKNNGNKKIYYRILSSKKKKFISFGDIIKKDNQINNNKNNNNIILKLSKSKSKIPKTILPKYINDINSYNSNNSRPKNYFNHKNIKINEQKEVNNNYFTIITKNNKESNIHNLFFSPQEQGLKIFVSNKKFTGEKKENKNKLLNENIIINKNPEYVKEYTEEILINLLIEEFIFNKKKKLFLNTEILNNYGINPIIRSCLIDSLIGLQETFQFCNKTLFITVKIFDNYISSIIAEKDKKSKIEDSDLDMIIVSCFLIASKMEESFIYHLTDYLTILSDKYSTSDLMNMEYNILKYYNFVIFEPNSLDFFEIFASFYELDEKSKNRGIKILFAILLNVDLSQMPSSIIAFAVIYILMEKNFSKMINKIDSLFYNLYRWSDWNDKKYNDKQKNETYSKYMKIIGPLKNENDVKEISDMILYFIDNIPKNEFNNTIKKIE